MSEGESTIAVLGAGSFGTAMGLQLARCGVRTLLWARDAEHIARLRENRVNQRYLPDAPFPDNLEPEADLETVISAADDVLSVVPSHAFRPMMERIAPLLRPGQRVANAAKGLEQGSAKLLHRVFEEVIEGDVPFATVSGPTFAKEIGAAMPTAVTVASLNEKFSNDLAAMLHNEVFRAYTSRDVIGVEVGGAVKNVLAIGVGIADGLGLGANTRAMIITRGLAEIMRLGVALGGKQDTFMGLSGMGDLVLTCTDNLSRNRRFGLALASGQGIDEAQDEIGQVVEGYRVAAEVARLSESEDVEMPIATTVYRVLYDNLSPREAVLLLSSRPRRPESA